jgi:hypothetical protein
MPPTTLPGFPGQSVSVLDQPGRIGHDNPRGSASLGPLRDRECDWDIDRLAGLALERRFGGHCWRGWDRPCRGVGWLVAEAKSPGELLLCCLIARGEADLAQQSALTPAPLGRFLEVQGSPKGVRGLGKPSASLSNLRDVVQRLGRLNAATRDRQRFRLAEQRPFIVRRPGGGGCVFHERLLDVVLPKQHAPQTGVWQGARGSDRGGSAIRLGSVLERSTQNGDMARSQRFLVALVQIVRHVHIMNIEGSVVSGTCGEDGRRFVLRQSLDPTEANRSKRSPTLAPRHGRGRVCTP